MSNRKVIKFDIKDDSMTDEAIQKAEKELKVTKSLAKVVQSPVEAAKVTTETAVKEAAPDKENARDTTNTTPIKVVSNSIWFSIVEGIHSSWNVFIPDWKEYLPDWNGFIPDTYQNLDMKIVLKIQVLNMLLNPEVSFFLSPFIAEI